MVGFVPGLDMGDTRFRGDSWTTIGDHHRAADLLVQRGRDRRPTALRTRRFGMYSAQGRELADAGQAEVVVVIGIPGLDERPLLGDVSPIAALLAEVLDEIDREDQRRLGIGLEAIRQELLGDLADPSRNGSRRSR